ncbi:MAG: 2-C-methyl-D-erythritol 4-phosphate cytidylyltransferase [Cyclobacteriaceae bacterium]
MKEYAIIVAGGSGSRMKSDIPKQYLEIAGKPILMHTIEAFYAYNTNIEIILVLPASEIETWKSLCKKHEFNLQHTIATGGNTRFHSVKNGLQLVQTEGLVAIHDGVRPLIHPDIIGASYRLAAIHGSAVAAVRLKESIRVTDKDTTRAVDRASYRIIQTPQTFKASLIKNAYRHDDGSGMTDDASLAEMYGVKISLFEGSYENIKITTPEDLVLAEAILLQRKKTEKP